MCCRSFFKDMQVVEIEDNLAVKIGELAKSENKSLTEFVDLSLREAIIQKTRKKTDEEKIKKFADSYRNFPQ